MNGKIAEAVRAERERIRSDMTLYLNGKGSWILRTAVRAYLEIVLKEPDCNCPECGTLLRFRKVDEYWCEQCQQIFYRKVDLRVVVVDKQHSKDER